MRLFESHLRMLNRVYTDVEIVKLDVIATTDWQKRVVLACDHALLNLEMAMNEFTVARQRMEDETE